MSNNKENKDSNKEIKKDTSNFSNPKKKSKFSCKEYCSLRNFNKYHVDSIVKSFSSEGEKTIESWDKFLLDKNFISKKVLDK